MKPSPVLLLFLLLAVSRAFAAPDTDSSAAKIEPPEIALKKLSVAPGLQVDLWASEPLLANPVALSFDEKGRAYVVETYRRRSTVPDIRKNTPWLKDVLSARSVEDRIAFFKEIYPPEKQVKPSKTLVDLNGDGQFDWRDWTIESERVKLVEDTDGDGKADQARVFADGFNALETGVAAGVLAARGSVWFTAVPNLWKLTPGGGDAPARKELLASGFGVHVAYSGHDLHGVKLGPDGKLYWTIADCGARVTGPDGKVAVDLPDTGAVFRANPDGSEIEVVAYGLRNPQSLAFNDSGDLFTGDNNADGGDKARWIHVVEGADYGWRIGWQFLPKLGAWNTEKLWELDTAKTALSMLPPVGHIGHGPAGIAYYPGVGLPEQYKGHFFYADFPGGVRSFALKPHGASYTVENPDDILLDNKQDVMQNKLLWGLYPSDVAFGAGGGLYVLDWVFGWEKTGKGRIFRVHDPAVDRSHAVQHVRQLLGSDLAARSVEELAGLLSYPDQRIRLAAQAALVARGESASQPLLAIAGAREPLVARLHALWALGQLGRHTPSLLLGVVPLLTDPASEVRAQAAKVLGDSRQPAHEPRLIPLLQDPEPRVRFFAALALGKCGGHDAVDPLLEMLRANADRDPYVRHAGVTALIGIKDLPALTARARDASDSVRTAVLLALRRLRSREVAAFLNDRSPQLVIEAARAIHDEPIDVALPQLASFPKPAESPLPVARRVLNAAFRLGRIDDARTVASLATNEKATESVRVEAIETLQAWNSDEAIDRFLSLYRPLPPGRDRNAGAVVSTEISDALLKSASTAVRVAGLNLVGRYKIAALEPAASALLVAEQGPTSVRIAALSALQALESSRFDDLLKTAIASSDPKLQEAARKLAAQRNPGGSLKDLVEALEKGSPAEAQNALQTLAAMPGVPADKVVEDWLDRLIAGKAPAPLHLEILTAASQRPTAAIGKKLAAYEAKRNAADPLSKWLECREGGDAERGREIFAEKAEAACMRCHKVSGVGGDVGPDLAGLAKKHDRDYLLAAIVAPNAAIAPGYESALLTLQDGNMQVGIVSAETADSITLTPMAGGEKSVVPKASIKQRDKVPSAMPEGLGDVLGKEALRDVVEYLATLK